MTAWVWGFVSGLHVAEWAGAVVAVSAATTVVYQKVVKPLRAFVRALKAWMARIEASVSWTEQQTKPNGGSSLLDKVDQLQGQVALLLRHDRERDRPGLRYGDETEDEPATKWETP